ncbi:MAG: branched-chain amino acid aminotransferase [Defluviitaleaceae bacterium]|nr:branched-chain amino acid aminotransferase [Defluviitaleaceae bacterium]
MNIKITQTQIPKEKPTGTLGFGRSFTDHMFLADYTEEKGWHDARIVPYGNLEISPAGSILHYGQGTWEGMKAYKAEDGSCYLFRPEKNARRINNSNERICIPQFPEEDFIHAVKTLVKTDAEWIPRGKDSSLYIRPFFIATDPYIGIAISKTYRFVIITAPCDAYFGSLKPVGIRIEDEYVRAVRGGTGRAKTGGNYAGSLVALARAQKENCAQAMWLDAIDRKYIEEVGTMNIFFKINGTIVTPRLNESILEGVTRDSVITLCRDFGLPLEERPIAVDEITAAAAAGTLEEIFGTGTAVVISPVNKLRYKNEEITVGNGETGEISRRLYDTISAIQRGDLPDKFNWRVRI